MREPSLTGFCLPSYTPWFRLVLQFLKESLPTMSDRHFVHHEDEVQLAKILRESKPWLEKYGTTAIYVMAAIMAVAAVVVYISRRPPATAPESRELMLASLSSSPSPEDYQAVADSTPNSKIGIIARVRQAELLLSNAVEKLFTDREKGLEELNAAATAFQRLDERKEVAGYQKERVLAGLARVAEAQCDGTDESIKAAVSAWERLLKEFPDSKLFREFAEQRVKKLSSESTRSFYAWFHSQNPKPSDDLQIPQDGPGTVPDIPKISLPDLTAPATKSDEAPASVPAASSEAKTGTPESPQETPAADKPAAEPKPESSQPASEAPAADPPKTPSPDAPAQPTEPQAPAAEPKSEAPASEPAEGTATPDPGAAGKPAETPGE